MTEFERVTAENEWLRNKLIQKTMCLEKVVQDLSYYLELNEENGVVYIPKFAVERMIKTWSLR